MKTLIGLISPSVNYDFYNSTFKDLMIFLIYEKNIYINSVFKMKLKKKIRPLRIFNSFRMCFIIVLLFCSLNFLLAQQLSVDWAAFNYSQGLSLVEVYYSCPYNIFHYKTKNDTISAQYRGSFYLKSINTPESIIDNFERRAIISSFEDAQKRDMMLVDGFGFFARPGPYWFRLTLEDAISTLIFTDTITVPNFEQAPALSDVELASSIKPDTLGGKFCKQGLRIIPNPSGKFGQHYELMYVYVEGYNLIDDTLPYEFTYRILTIDNDSKQSIIKTFPTEIKKKSGSSFAYAFALSTKGLKPGSYLLEIQLKDNTSNQTASSRKVFSISGNDISTATLVKASLPLEDTFYYRKIDLLATPKELKQYQKLTYEGKNEFLRRFWRKYNYAEFIKRIKYVETKYQFAGKSGWETDRGKIYIKYGAPDEIIAHTMIEHVKPHEHWYYYEKGFHFIFIDIRNDGTFPLIYSNTDLEKKHPEWEKYIDPLELDDLR
ncbi:MAG: GWxTD domain-containing protein [candidate division WOR-3 bacterium]|nr:GWxTD domain-containing protein [candidate division WOR-3 bacterium]